MKPRHWHLLRLHKYCSSSISFSITRRSTAKNPTRICRPIWGLSSCMAANASACSTPTKRTIRLVERMERPPSPRAWEAVQLEPAAINKLVVIICQALLRDESKKNLRLLKCGLGLLAYFACEKIQDTVDAYYQGNFTEVISNALETFEGDMNSL
eukprot:Polyplicarium_translucidae@DN2254_c0_g1_i2.p2